MTTLIQFLLSRTDHFIIELNNMSVSAFPSWLEKEINDLSCLLAMQAKQIRQKSHNDPETMLNEIMYWFRNNVEYVNTNRLSDHSAVGLIRTGTAVCQGIAAYAYLLLYYCGIGARYVIGDGLGANGWEPHGWNMVFYNNQWRHIDYTFGLNSHSRTVLKPESTFRRNHRWDETRYSPMQSSIVLNSKKILRKSIITCIPNQSCLSINGCIIDMRHTHVPCIILANKVLISVLSVVALIGGSYCIKETDMQIFINRNQHSIPMAQLLLVNGNWYTEVANLNTLGFSLTIEGKAISFRYNS